MPGSWKIGSSKIIRLYQGGVSGLFPHGTSGRGGRNKYYLQIVRRVLSSDHLRNTVLKLLSFFLVHAERKRLRKPSKRLLEYAEEYDHLFAPKKKSRKGQEQLQKVGEG